jgi:iron only hydrogenase large subunit-like protein
MRRCPTQAIRVRKGKAVISEELCVDCGECISVCPVGAIVPMADPVEGISNFKYKVVVPAPVLYTQFDASIHPYIIHLALKKVGFDAVVDVSTSTSTLAKTLGKYIESYHGRLPLISSYCPSVVRLIQVKYPDLVELIVPMDVPREVTAREIRSEYPARLGLKPEDIGIFYIANCPAKIVSIKQPAEKAKSFFDGVVSIRDVYSVLHPHVVAIKEGFDVSQVPADFAFTSGWETSGSIIQAAKRDNWLSVSGLDHVRRVLDDIENSRLRNIVYVEAMAHMLGCISGPFNVENPYIARTNTRRLRERYDNPPKLEGEEAMRKTDIKYYLMDHAILPRPLEYFDTDLVTSIKRMKEKERVYQKLRQIDCGCCGSPTCMAFAEDFVKGEVKLTSCIFLSQKGDSEEE